MSRRGCSKESQRTLPNILLFGLESVLILSLVIISVSCFCLKMCEWNRQVSLIALLLKAEGRLFDGDWKRIILDWRSFALLFLSPSHSPVSGVQIRLSARRKPASLGLTLAPRAKIQALN